MIIGLSCWNYTTTRQTTGHWTDHTYYCTYQSKNYNTQGRRNAMGN